MLGFYCLVVLEVISLTFNGEIKMSNEEDKAELVYQPPTEDHLFTPENARKQADFIIDVIKACMDKGLHYGIIPGTNKPTLLQPGAEKLCMVFRVSPQYKTKKTNLPKGHREYEVSCILTDSGGRVVGEGLGMTTSLEAKYRYRYASKKCPQCEGSFIIKGKEEYGGGWLCFGKKGGCGAKYEDGDEAIESQKVGQIENPDPADQFNTILKMAKKRAFVDAVKATFAVSDVFTQDLEDMKIDPKDGKTPPDPKEKKTGKKSGGGNGKDDTPPDNGKPPVISEELAKGLVDLAHKKNFTEHGFKEIIKSYGFDKTIDITVDKYDDIHERIAL